MLMREHLLDSGLQRQCLYKKVDEWSKCFQAKAKPWIHYSYMYTHTLINIYDNPCFIDCPSFLPIGSDHWTFPAYFLHDPRATNVINNVSSRNE